MFSTWVIIVRLYNGIFPFRPIPISPKYRLYQMQYCLWEWAKWEWANWERGEMGMVKWEVCEVGIGEMGIGRNWNGRIGNWAKWEWCGVTTVFINGNFGLVRKHNSGESPKGPFYDRQDSRWRPRLA